MLGVLKWVPCTLVNGVCREENLLSDTGLFLCMVPNTTNALLGVALPNLQIEHKRLSHAQLDVRHSRSPCMPFEGGSSSLGEE